MTRRAYTRLPFTPAPAGARNSAVPRALDPSRRGDHRGEARRTPRHVVSPWGAAPGSVVRVLVALALLWLGPWATGAGSVLEFPKASCAVMEGMGPLALTVRRSHDLATFVTVRVRTEDVTAVADQDYAARDSVLRLIEECQRQYRVDPRRIYVMGHSNGGFMSHRMAGDHADLIARIGAAVELWTLHGSGHLPSFRPGTVSTEIAERAIDWLLAHPKPAPAEPVDNKSAPRPSIQRIPQAREPPGQSESGNRQRIGQLHPLPQPPAGGPEVGTSDQGPDAVGDPPHSAFLGDPAVHRASRAVRRNPALIAASTWERWR